MKENEIEFLHLKKKLKKLDSLHISYDYVKITLASSKKIKLWSQRISPKGHMIGEVLYPETLNFRTNKPHAEGLFCERIFGPMENWKCSCGKYNGFLVNKICERCFVEITETRIRRYRTGYIDLMVPVTHIWYLKGTPSYIYYLLRYYYDSIIKGKTQTQIENIPSFSLKDLEEIIYLRRGTQLDIPIEHCLYPFFYSTFGVARNELNPHFQISETDSIFKKLGPNKNHRNPFSSYYTKGIRRRFGAELVQVALEHFPLQHAISDLRQQFEKPNYVLKEKKNNPIYLKMVRIMESFLSTKTNPSLMVLTTVSVLPPSLRPLVELESGHLVSADVNEMYRLLIIRNRRLFDFLYIWHAPDIITVQSRKLLQEMVDSLIDNGRVSKNRQINLNNNALKGLTEILEGKTGRFRQTLLGKRVDYSGRSVIIVGPSLRLNQCGIPYDMAIELFYPFLIREIIHLKIKKRHPNLKLANLILQKHKPLVWKLIEKITKKYTVLLNRAPTLHRFGIQAFDPVLILGQAIHLHPLVCTGFNADFDGDQMALHLPLYQSTQFEAKTMMRPSYHVLSPSNGEVILKPTQDMVM